MIFFSWSFRCYSDTTANTALYTAQKHSNDTGHLHCNDISNFVKPVEKNLGIYSLIGRTSYRKIWWSLEIARFGLRYFQSLWNLAGTLAPSIHKISLQLRLKSPASPLFTQSFIQTQVKENIKTPRHWPLCGEYAGNSPGTGEFPAQMASNAENVSIDDAIMYDGKTSYRLVIIGPGLFLAGLASIYKLRRRTITGVRSVFVFYLYLQTIWH